VAAPLAISGVPAPPAEALPPYHSTRRPQNFGSASEFEDEEDDDDESMPSTALHSAGPTEYVASAILEAADRAR
jgi:hypothetical protein